MLYRLQTLRCFTSPPSGLLLVCSSQPVQASAGLSLVSATPILWSRLLKNAPPSSMYEEVAPAASTLSAAAGAGARKGSSKGSAARDEVSASVAAAVRAVIGADVEPDASLMASGLDSLGSVVSAGCGCLSYSAVPSGNLCAEQWHFSLDSLPNADKSAAERWPASSA